MIPLMCDMLLDAQSGDVGLWSPILADACRHADLRRVLILRVFPRVVRSTVADAFARSGEILAPLWEEVILYCGRTCLNGIGIARVSTSSFCHELLLTM